MKKIYLVLAVFCTFSICSADDLSRSLALLKAKLLRLAVSLQEPLKLSIKPEEKIKEEEIVKKKPVQKSIKNVILGIVKKYNNDKKVEESGVIIAESNCAPIIERLTENQSNGESLNVLLDDFLDSANRSKSTFKNTNKEVITRCVNEAKSGINVQPVQQKIKSNKPEIKKPIKPIINIKKEWTLPIPNKWNLSKQQTNQVAWLKSIEQYNGWICGWMALFNAVSMDKALKGKAPKSLEEAIQAFYIASGDVKKQYTDFAQFQGTSAAKAYDKKLKNLFPVQKDAIAPNYQDQQKLVQLGVWDELLNNIKLIDKNDFNASSLDIKRFERIITNEKRRSFLYFFDMSNESLQELKDLMSTDMSLNDALTSMDNKPCWLYSLKNQKGYSPLHVQSLTSIGEKEIQQTLNNIDREQRRVIIILQYDKHYSCITRVKLADGSPIVLLMNSQNEHDAKFKTETIGTIIKELLK